VALAAPLDALAAARGQLFVFLPVLLGIGIGLWFLWPSEPGAAVYAAAVGLALAGAGLRWRGAERWQAPGLALACLCAGFLAAGFRAHDVAAPMLAARYHGPVEGRLVAVDRSGSDALRITLDRVVLVDLPPEATPARVRVSLHGAAGQALPEPGATLILTASLAAPEGAPEPGGFDFRRMAWFDRLGAVGFTRSPVLVLEPATGGALAVGRLRLHLSAAIRGAVPGDAGAFAAGVLTGDRSGLSLQAVEDLRDSSLAHLLAISGMNMAFLTAFVFALVRGGVALVPPLALRVNAKKLAALVALPVAAFYLALSGANVATERAFIMVAVALGAVLFDRRALSLRSVAVAATILLVWQPEALVEAGFQMSFAATLALIVTFRALDRAALRARLPWGAMPLVLLVLTSLVGGLSTAPFAALHFNRFTDFGLVANLLTVPVMGAVVMPAGVVAGLLAPLGLAAPALWVMQAGSAWILGVARMVAGWEGAVTAIPAPPAWAVPVMALGALWAILWPGRARWAGAGAAALALAAWPLGTRPDLIVAGDGRLAGLLTAEGRALSAPRGNGFAARHWLEEDGDLVDQAAAAARPGFLGPKEARSFAVGGLKGVLLTGKGAAAALPAACAAHALVITPARAGPDPGPCLMLDAGRLAVTGPVAIRLAPEGLRIRGTRDIRRLWTATAPP
jgi:competence protein ComEC